MAAKRQFTKADNDKDGFLSQTELANQLLEKNAPSCRAQICRNV